MTKQTNQLVSNRAARHHYEVLDTYEAGICLVGTEIKSLRDNGGNLQDSYVKITSNELWLVASYIAPYKHGNRNNHEERRERKLLMHKREIARLKAQIQEKGLSLVPLSMYLKNGRVKVQMALAKGKKTFDKRETIKSRDEKRRIQRTLRDIS